MAAQPTRHTKEEKAKAVAELEAGGRVEEVAKRYKVTGSTLYAWRKKSKSNGAAGTAKDSTTYRDAIVYLEHAQRDLIKRIRAGKLKEIDETHLLAMLALRTLKS